MAVPIKGGNATPKRLARKTTKRLDRMQAAIKKLRTDHKADQEENIKKINRLKDRVTELEGTP